MTPRPPLAPRDCAGLCFCEFNKLGDEVLLFAGPALDRRDGDTVLEPSAGTGSLVAAATHPGVKIVAKPNSVLGSDAEAFGLADLEYQSEKLVSEKT
jgi:hypothetical protein